MDPSAVALIPESTGLTSTGLVLSRRLHHHLARTVAGVVSRVTHAGVGIGVGEPPCT